MVVAIILILALLSYFDIRYRIVPNVVTIPMIAFGIYLTGNWMWAGVAFSVMAMAYREKIFCGGDVKLMTMLAAFIGAGVVIPFFISLFFLGMFRCIKRMPVPYTPFLLAGFLWTVFLMSNLRTTIN
jgi:Flp pilus assembly protein protease CpaA